MLKRLHVTTKARGSFYYISLTPIHHCIVIQRMQNSHPEVLEQFKKEVMEEGILHEADTLGAEDETLL